MSEGPWWCAALALLAFGVGIPAQHGDMFLPSGAILLWLATLAGALVLGAASWYGVERPLQRALRAGERRPEEAHGRTPDVDAGVHSAA